MREEHAHNGVRVYTQIPRFEITMVGNSNRHTTWRHFRTCIDRQRFFRECVARDTSERRVVQERLKQEGRREDFLELDAELASERLEGFIRGSEDRSLELRRDLLERETQRVRGGHR